MRSLVVFLKWICPSALVNLNLRFNMIETLKGVAFPPTLQYLYLSRNEMVTLEGVAFPPTLKYLALEENKITSLEGAVFPSALVNLNLSFNKITSLGGAVFPPTLESLNLNQNEIASLESAVFPPALRCLGFTGNPISMRFVNDQGILVNTKAWVKSRTCPAQEDDEGCCVCMEYRANVRMNCGHTVLCGSCTFTVLATSNACPICRGTIAKQMLNDSQ